MELILNTFGTSLGKENNAFIITHKDGRQRIPVNGIKSIQISRGSQITSDAVILAIENEIQIIFTDNSGNPIGRIWSPKYGSISTIRKGQINFCFTKDAVEWIKKIIQKKIENQQALILMMMPLEDNALKITIQKSINKLEDYRNKIGLLDGEIVNDIASTLRGWEGIASKIYFQTLNFFIPDNYKFKERSQHPAMDVVNALLNYGYGLLYSKIEGMLIKTGIDPYIGILHRDNYNRPVLVYDIIELYRVWIDYVVYRIIIQGAVTNEYFSVKEDGSYWLEPLGRRVLIQSVNDYLEEVITQKGISRSRSYQIMLYCQDFAQQLKKYEAL
jgi:CRISPR-associated endonuclease Cas1